MSAIVNPYNKTNITDAEYRRHLLAIASKLKRGEQIVSNEAALFRGQKTKVFLQLLSDRGFKPKKVLDRIVFDKQDILLITRMPKRNHLNAYTGKSMNNKGTQRALQAGIEALL